MRRKELIGMKKIDYLTAIEKNTWFHLGCNSISQTLYCLKRMSDPCLEHIDNRFNPLPEAWIKELIPLRDQTVALLDETRRMIAERDYSNADKVLVDANAAKRHTLPQHSPGNTGTHKHDKAPAEGKQALLYSITKRTVFRPFLLRLLHAGKHRPFYPAKIMSDLF